MQVKESWRVAYGFVGLGSLALAALATHGQWSGHAINAGMMVVIVVAVALTLERSQN